MTIHKYPLVIAGLQVIRMPASAKILTAQFQGDVLCLWAMVDPLVPKADALIEIYGTGHKLSDELFGSKRNFVATAQRGGLVWHVFLITK